MQEVYHLNTISEVRSCRNAILLNPPPQHLHPNAKVFLIITTTTTTIIIIAITTTTSSSFSNDIKMKFGLEKCARISLKNGTVCRIQHTGNTMEN
jgi:hypothetical protein